MHSLLNDPATASFHFLLIQEPYISPFTVKPVSHANWILILPDHPSCPPNAAPEDKTTKSLIYANRSIPSTALSSITTNSNCVAAAQLSIADHRFTIISAYAPPKQSHKLADLRPLLKSPPSPTCHTIVAMDCNLHHALWNPPTYAHTHREADDLILTMGEAGLDLRSECGVPTFFPSNSTHANTTVDLLWLSPTCHGWATLCQTDTDHNFSHLSDHAAILTTILLPSPIPPRNNAYRQWKSFDPTRFEKSLTHRLSTASHALNPTPSNQEELDSQADLLTDLVTQALNETLPLTQLHPTAKRWWDTTTLGPLKAKAQQLRRFAHLCFACNSPLQ